MRRWFFMNILILLLKGMIFCLHTEALSPPEHEEKILHEYHLPTGGQALLYSRLFTDKMEVAGTRRDSQRQLLYVEIEDSVTLEKRRVWQQSFTPFDNDPIDRISSIVFAAGDTEKILCLGLASKYEGYYYLIDTTQTIIPEEQHSVFKTERLKMSPVETLPYYLHFLTVFSHDSVEGDELLTYGATLEGIAYSQQEGWRLDIRMHDTSYTLIGTLPNGLPALWNEQLTWFSARYEEGNLQEHPVSWRVIRK